MRAVGAERFREGLNKACVLKLDEESIPIGELEARAIDRATRPARTALPPTREMARSWPLLTNQLAICLTGKYFLSTTYLSRERGRRRDSGATPRKPSRPRTHPGAPVRLMALREDKPTEVKVFIRGNPRTLGPEAPRSTFTALRAPTPRRFPRIKRPSAAREAIATGQSANGSGVVNRVGAGISGWAREKPSDFGRRRRPTNPELLDRSPRFMENGWRFKKLHRLILTTARGQESQRTSAAFRGVPRLAARSRRHTRT